MMTRLF